MNYSAATITANCLDEEQELLHSPLCACSCLQQVWDHRVWSSAQRFRSEQVRIRLWLWWITGKKIKRSVLLVIVCQSTETGKDHLRGLFHTFLDKQKANALTCVGRERCRKLFLLCHRGTQGRSDAETEQNSEFICTRSAKKLASSSGYNSQVFPKYFKCISTNTAFQRRFLRIHPASTSCALQRFAKSKTICIPECYSITHDCLRRLQRG